MESRRLVQPNDWILFFAVLAGCFGGFVTTSIMMLGGGQAASPADPASQAFFSQISLLGLAATELFTGMLAIVALVACGWRAEDLPFRIGWRETLIGVGLAAAVLVQDILLDSGGTQLSEAAASEFRLPLLAVILVSVVNPVFEETFVVGFIVRFLEWRGVANWAWLAFAASVAIRVSYHLYQGLGEVPDHVFMGMLFAGLFLWIRNLWPLVLAHGLLNALGFLPYLV